MQTQKEFEAEKKKEAEFNALADQVIKYLPFGKWYSYMLAASNMLTKNLPKCIAVDNKDGRPYVQYKGDMAKFAGVFAQATHRSVVNDISQKHFLKGLIDLSGGQVLGLIKQYKKKNVTVYYNLSPNDITNLWSKHLEKSNPVIAQKIEDVKKKDELDKQKLLGKQKNEKKKKLNFFQKLFRSLSHH